MLRMPPQHKPGCVLCNLLLRLLHMLKRKNFTGLGLFAMVGMLLLGWVSASNEGQSTGIDLGSTNDGQVVSRIDTQAFGDSHAFFTSDQSAYEPAYCRTVEISNAQDSDPRTIRVNANIELRQGAEVTQYTAALYRFDGTYRLLERLNTQLLPLYITIADTEPSNQQYVLFLYAEVAGNQTACSSTFVVQPDSRPLPQVSCSSAIQKIGTNNQRRLSIGRYNNDFMIR